MHIHKNHYYKSIQTLYNIHNKKNIGFDTQEKEQELILNGHKK